MIQVNNISKIYTNPRKSLFAAKTVTHALKSVSLSLNNQETLGIVGESGCGKSTLGKAMARLITIDSGDITYDFKPDFNKQRPVQYIFQDPKAALNQHKNVGWLLEEPLRNMTTLNKEQRKKRVLELLERVSLSTDYLNYYPHELSGGQAQRIAILSAIISNPKVLIADEAVSALDVSIQAQILNFLNHLKKEFKLSMIFITHDLHVCHYMSDRIGVMYNGEVVEIGEADEIFFHPKHPYTQELLKANLSIKTDSDYKMHSEPVLIKNNEGCPFINRCPFKLEKCYSNHPQLTPLNQNVSVQCFLYEKTGDQHETSQSF